MPFIPAQFGFAQAIGTSLVNAFDWVQEHLVGHRFSGHHALGDIPLIDERLRPKAPMPKAEIALNTELLLSQIGLHNTRTVTAQSHPELHRAWGELCHRAGYNEVPPLVIAESPVANAMVVHDGTMVITTGLLSMLTLRETAGVMAHELGHGRRDHMTVRAAALGGFAGAGALLGNYLGKIPQEAGESRARFGKVGEWIQKYFTPTDARPSLLGNALMIVGFGAMGQIAANQIAVKPTELQADLDGVSISGDPEALASALLKMQAADKRGPIMRWFGYLESGYPTMGERVDNIRRAAQQVPQNPVPSAQGPVPSPKVSGVALDAPVAAAQPQAELG